ncbi:hypothetical protein KM043_011829 [Ampulex compressa]|nr:hypothetical protein KM043_011829 [Ampulex compressa]
MDVVPSEAALRHTMSKFGDLMITAKSMLRKLQTEASEKIRELDALEETSGSLKIEERDIESQPRGGKSKGGEDYKEKNCQAAAMIDLEKHLSALEVAGRVSVLDF